MTAENRHPYRANGQTGSAIGGEMVTPSDVNELTYLSRAIWVGTSGILVVVMRDGTELTFVGATGMMDLEVKQVKATSSSSVVATASDIVALY